MNWENLYRNKVTDADTALATIKSGVAFTSVAAPAYRSRFQALVHRADTLRNVEITHILTFAEAPYTRPEYQHAFRVNALFIGSNVRQAVREGRRLHAYFLGEIRDYFGRMTASTRRRSDLRIAARRARILQLRR